MARAREVIDGPRVPRIRPFSQAVRADTVIHRPAHGVTLRDMVGALRDDAKAALLRAIPRLPTFWRQVAEERRA